MLDYKQMLRELPAVDKLLKEPLLQQALTRIPRRLLLKAVQDTLDVRRAKIAAVRDNPALLEELHPDPEKLAQDALNLAETEVKPHLKPLINATGVIIHTNLGRVPLADRAVCALINTARSYSNLEMDLYSGNRGSRQAHLEKLLAGLCEAEAAFVVNNNAAAVFVTLNSIAKGKEVIVSRGQLVEIGGSFRIPDIMAASGACLVEVGTTNKTYLADYEAALNDHSAALLKVHTSNYQMIGFTAEVATSDLALLSRKYNLPLIEDLGSGVLLDLAKHGLPFEPRVQDSIKAGADLVTFSGDKMLGGPQAGIIVGKKELVKKIRSNQLSRALRVDKFTVAALEETLRLYLDEEEALREIPLWRMLTMPAAELQSRAANLACCFAEIFGKDTVSVIPGISRVGGGALPMADLPTSLVAVKLAGPDLKAEDLSFILRIGSPAVVARVQQDMILFDPRTIRKDEEDQLLTALKTGFFSLADRIKADS